MSRETDFRKLTYKAAALLPMIGAVLLTACREPSESIFINSTTITKTKDQIAISGSDLNEVERARKVIVVDCKGKDVPSKEGFRVLNIDVPEECMKNLKSQGFRNRLFSN